MREGGVSVQGEERSGREVALLSGMNYRRFFDSWCRLCGNIAFAKLILKRPAYLGRDNQPDLSENNPSFHSFTFFFSPLPFFSFLSSCLFFSLWFSPLCTRWGWHARPWQWRWLIETAIVYQRIPLMERPSRFCWNICTNLLEAASITRGPLLGNKHASSRDRQSYSPACVLH